MMAINNQPQDIGGWLSVVVVSTSNGKRLMPNEKRRDWIFILMVDDGSWIKTDNENKNKDD